MTERDLQVIDAVYIYRVLSAPQIERLFFADGQQGARIARRRLQKLFHNGYLIREELPTKLSEGSLPFLYFLDRKGADVLLTGLGYVSHTWKPGKNHLRPLFLNHRLAINDVRIACELDARRRGFKIQRWLNEDVLNASKEYVSIGGRQGEERVQFVPDAYFELVAGDTVYHFFLEVDRATETGSASAGRDWARKIRVYGSYYASGAFEKRFGTKDMRLLTVTTGPVRLANLRRVTAQMGGKGRFWFTTLEAANSGQLFTDLIWQTASNEVLRPIKL